LRLQQLGTFSKKQWSSCKDEKMLLIKVLAQRPFPCHCVETWENGAIEMSTYRAVTVRTTLVAFPLSQEAGKGCSGVEEGRKTVFLEHLLVEGLMDVKSLQIKDVCSPQIDRQV